MHEENMASRYPLIDTNDVQRQEQFSQVGFNFSSN